MKKKKSIFIFHLIKICLVINKKYLIYYTLIFFFHK